MSFLKTTLKTMGKGFAHSHSEENLNFSIQSGKGTTTKATTEQKFINQQLEPSQENSKRKFIAMYLGSDLPEKMMTYVLDTCQHLGHDLAVISFEQNATTDEALRPYQTAFEDKNINVKKVKLSGHPMQELNKYLKSHRDIVFLACKETGFLGRSYMSGNLAKISLPVPLVVVTTEEEANAAAPADSIQNNEIKEKVA